MPVSRQEVTGNAQKTRLFDGALLPLCGQESEVVGFFEVRKVKI